jgi:hypothetical protein
MTGNDEPVYCTCQTGGAWGTRHQHFPDGLVRAEDVGGAWWLDPETGEVDIASFVSPSWRRAHGSKRSSDELAQRDAPRALIALIDDADVRAGDVIRLPSMADDPSGLGSWVVAKTGLTRDGWDVTAIVEDAGGSAQERRFPAGQYLAVLAESDERISGIPSSHDPRLRQLPEFVRERVESPVERVDTRARRPPPA